MTSYRNGKIPSSGNDIYALLDVHSLQQMHLFQKKEQLVIIDNIQYKNSLYINKLVELSMLEISTNHTLLTQAPSWKFKVCTIQLKSCQK